MTFANSTNSSSEAIKFKEQGNEEFKKKDFISARELYTKAIELDSSEPSLYTNRAACNLQLGRYDDAVRDGEKALSLDKNFIKGYFRTGQALLALGKIDYAYDKFQQAIKIAPKDPQVNQELDKIKQIKVHMNKTQTLVDKASWEEALREIGYALTLSPQSIPFKIQKGEILIELKRFDEASKLAGSILQNDASNSSDAMFLRGKALYYMGNSQQGSSLLLEALNLDPDNNKCLQFRKKIQKIEALKKEGNDLLTSSQFEKAYEKYSEAIEIDPNANNLNSQLFCNRAAAAQKMNNHKLALEDATKAIELNPEYTKAYQRRVASYMKLENFEDALYDLNKIKELEPENNEVNKQIKDLQKKVKAAKRKDYYKILGIEKNATNDEIEKAYRKVAFANHPDRFPVEEKEERTKAFHDIGEAKSILSDSQKRAAYDNGADIDDINNGGGGGGFGGMGGMDMSDLFNMFGGMGGMGGMGGGRRGGGGGGGGGMPGGFSFNFGGEEDMGGFNPFGGGFQQSGGKKKRQYKK